MINKRAFGWLCASLLFGSPLCVLAESYHYYQLPSEFLKGNKLSLDELDVIEQELRLAIEQAKAEENEHAQTSLSQTLETVKSRVESAKRAEQKKQVEKEQRVLRAMYKKGSSSREGISAENIFIGGLVLATTLPAIILMWKLVYDVWKL